MSSKENRKQVTKLPGFAESFAGNFTDSPAGKAKLRSKCEHSPNSKGANSSKAASPVHTGSASRSSESRSKFYEEDTRAFPGNTLSQGYHSPSKSAATTINLSPSTSPQPPGRRNYWETVLGPKVETAKPGKKGSQKRESIEKPHKCRLCSMSFKKRCNLVSHVSNVHEKIRPFQCSVCTRTFARKSNCVKHVRFSYASRDYAIFVILSRLSLTVFFSFALALA